MNKQQRIAEGKLLILEQVEREMYEEGLIEFTIGPNGEELVRLTEKGRALKDAAKKAD